eukprot:3825390-Pleurochrysis_carterae.AAC.1
MSFVLGEVDPRGRDSAMLEAAMYSKKQEVLGRGAINDKGSKTRSTWKQNMSQSVADAGRGKEAKTQGEL